MDERLENKQFPPTSLALVGPIRGDVLVNDIPCEAKMLLYYVTYEKNLDIKFLQRQAHQQAVFQCRPRVPPRYSVVV